MDPVYAASSVMVIAAFSLVGNVCRAIADARRGQRAKNPNSSVVKDPDKLKKWGYAASIAGGGLALLIGVIGYLNS